VCGEGGGGEGGNASVHFWLGGFGVQSELEGRFYNNGLCLHVSGYVELVWNPMRLLLRTTSWNSVLVFCSHSQTLPGSRMRRKF
jgi:hypothetical protein